MHESILMLILKSFAIVAYTGQILNANLNKLYNKPFS